MKRIVTFEIVTSTTRGNVEVDVGEDYSDASEGVIRAAAWHMLLTDRLYRREIEQLVSATVVNIR